MIETFVSQNTLGLIFPLLRDESPELASNSLVLLNSLLATSGTCVCVRVRVRACVCVVADTCRALVYLNIVA